MCIEDQLNKISQEIWAAAREHAAGHGESVEHFVLR